jgi:hypothetical protein
MRGGKIRDVLLTQIPLHSLKLAENVTNVDGTSTANCDNSTLFHPLPLKCIEKGRRQIKSILTEYKEYVHHCLKFVQAFLRYMHFFKVYCPDI